MAKFYFEVIDTWTNIESEIHEISARNEIEAWAMIRKMYGDPSRYKINKVIFLGETYRK